MVNQQVTLLSFNNGTSETACDITLKLDNYLNQNKTGFLVWFIGLKKVYKKVYFDISVSIKDIQVIYYIKQELGKVMIKDQGGCLDSHGGGGSLGTGTVSFFITEFLVS